MAGSTAVDRDRHRAASHDRAGGGQLGGTLATGLIAGILGAILGTLGGRAGRARLAAMLGSDPPAALVEDAIAIGSCTPHHACAALTRAGDVSG